MLPFEFFTTAVPSMSPSRMSPDDVVTSALPATRSTVTLPKGCFGPQVAGQVEPDVAHRRLDLGGPELALDLEVAHRRRRVSAEPVGTSRVTTTVWPR